MTASALLEAQNISCSRAGRALFDNVNFRLEPGRVLLIEGVNGSGKSSLLRILAGLRQPDSGTIFWRGQEIHSSSLLHHDRMMWLGHRNGINDQLTAYENLQFFAGVFSRGHQNIKAILSRVGLSGHANRNVGRFSAGMKRRLAIARLLLDKRSLWLLDEPEVGLDKAGMALLYELITEHVAASGSVVMTSHHGVGFDSDVLQSIGL